MPCCRRPNISLYFPRSIYLVEMADVIKKASLSKEAFYFDSHQLWETTIIRRESSWYCACAMY
jgi:hypothetical protein